MQYILDASLIETEDALAKQQKSSDQLKIYLQTSLDFFRSDPAISKIYIAFYYLSSFNKVYFDMNEKLKSEAVQRILNILAIGLGRGEFKIENPLLAAKVIHIYITGLLLNLATENSQFSDELLLEKLQRDCLLSVGVTLFAFNS